MQCEQILNHIVVSGQCEYILVSLNHHLPFTANPASSSRNFLLTDADQKQVQTLLCVAVFVQTFSLLLKTEVTNQGQVVGGVAEGREPVQPDLLLRGQLQNRVHPQRVPGVPDVVQSGAALP